jgi:excisionase family DNA binding protein
MSATVTPITRLLYDRKSAAQMLSISVRSLDHFVANKRINFRRFGRRVLIPHSELVRFARADHFEIKEAV